MKLTHGDTVITVSDHTNVVLMRGVDGEILKSVVCDTLIEAHTKAIQLLIGEIAPVHFDIANQEDENAAHDAIVKHLDS